MKKREATNQKKRGTNEILKIEEKEAPRPFLGRVEVNDGSSKEVEGEEEAKG